MEMARPEGFEPPTWWVEATCSESAELRAHVGSAKELQTALQNVSEPSAFAAPVVCDPVVLFAVRPNLVATLTRSDLSGPQACDFGPRVTVPDRLNASLELGPGLPTVGMLISTVHFHRDSGGLVRQHDTAVGFVFVLSTRAAVSRKAHLNIALVKHHF